MAIPHFIHLRARSAYSLLESSLHINQIKDLCIENNMPAICISDSNLFGALEFSETMSSNGIQPLIGATLNVSLNYTPTSSSNPIQSSICLIAMTEIGYKNLLKLSSSSFQKNNALFPFVTIEEIYKVKVQKLNSLNVKSKPRVFKGQRGTRSELKRIIVTLKEGNTIDMSGKV